MALLCKLSDWFTITCLLSMSFVIIVSRDTLNKTTQSSSKYSNSYYNLPINLMLSERSSLSNIVTRTGKWLFSWRKLGFINVNVIIIETKKIPYLLNVWRNWYDIENRCSIFEWRGANSCFLKKSKVVEWIVMCIVVECP